MALEVRDLVFSYEKKPVLRGVSFQVAKGSVLACLGANGAGKTTLFRCILGLLKQKYKGEILVNGQNVREFTSRQRAHKIAYIPQSQKQLFQYSVLDMVLMGTSHQVSSFSMPGGKQVQLAKDALLQVGISDLEQNNYAWISGGEQQLVLIARALAQQAGILVMDEPTSALDFGNQARVLDRVRSLAKESYTVLLSTHNPQHALTYADNVMVLKDGKVAAFGKPSEVLTAEMIWDLYGVKAEICVKNGRYVLMTL